MRFFLFVSEAAGVCIGVCVRTRVFVGSFVCFMPVFCVYFLLINLEPYSGRPLRGLSHCRFCAMLTVFNLLI